MMCSASVAGISSSRARPSRRLRWLLATTTRRPPGSSRPGADSNLIGPDTGSEFRIRPPDDGRTLKVLQIADRIKADVTTAMKAGERERVTALRLVLSELQKAEKDGGDGDEVAVLRRERKRRREAETAYREAGRDELAEGEALRGSRSSRPTCPQSSPTRSSKRSFAREWRRRAQRPRATWGG